MHLPFIKGLEQFNEKIGGVNFAISLSQPLLKNYSRLVRDDPQKLNAKFFGPDTMLVGIDTAHAPPQSFADRMNGVPVSEPTVVGVSRCRGGVCSLPSRLEKPRSHVAGTGCRSRV